MQSNLILVDENDKIIGTAEKLDAHKKGLLHRAFSILIFNSKNEILLQRRALHKYHSGGLWTNACCSHPRINEDLYVAIHKRLLEEMGFDCALEKKFEFIYKIWFEKDQIFEYEYDHVFVGKYDGFVIPNSEEADEIKWIALYDLMSDLKENPENYTFWFKEIIAKTGW
ncbi:MAG: Isopentenyl-diphosphate Delta-isomerase [candidate division TM6 bacterium GW2011_GWF2_37_49]|nr:MAG: Isopentenyl-diphosphate Delta-isomerase [candidate division TM6 bacterium GW2011_GWF2_37_49]